MKPSRQSWHYKLYSRFWNGKDPKNFCAYFWGAFGLTIMFLFIGSIFGLLAFSVLAGMIFYPFHIKDHFEHDSIKETLQSGGQFGWGIAAIAIVAAIIYFTATGNNLIKIWIQAFFGRYCPKIEWAGKAPEKEYSDFELLEKITHSYNENDGQFSFWLDKAVTRIKPEEK